MPEYVDPKPPLQLTGMDGNAFSILGRARQTLKNYGASSAYIEQYTKEATSGDYDHLLATTMKYFTVS